MKTRLTINAAVMAVILAGCGEKPENTTAIDKAVKETQEASQAIATAAQNTTSAALETAKENVDKAVVATESAAKTASAETQQAADKLAAASKATADKAAAAAKEATHKAATATETAAQKVAASTAPVPSGAMPDWIKPPTYDCATCHAIETKKVGPAWKDVAAKYKGDAKAKAMLMEKVKKGGKGNWGQVPMTAHPKLTDAELTKVVDFVLSLK